jgi:protein ImuB
MFGAIYGVEGSTRGALLAVAREFSPRIDVGQEPRSFDVARAREVVLDLSGLTRLFGDARTIAEELRRTAADRGLQIRVAIAGTRTAARLMVRYRAGISIIEPGTEAEALASLPLALLGDLLVNSQLPIPPPSRPETEARFGETSPELVTRARQAAADNAQPLPTLNSQTTFSWELGAVLKRWGLRTLGDLAALSADDVAARLGQEGVRAHRLACGEDAAPLVPAVPEERFEQSLDLEWPIEELEPLAFVLGRLLEPLEAHLERRGRGAAVLHVKLFLVKTSGGARQVHARSLQLPTPIRDARTLRTLALLDLESHPPCGPIDRVVVAVDPTPARIIQFSLITRPLPSPEQISTLMARLQALMGETRCGSPSLVDSWRAGAFEMRPFLPREGNVAPRASPLALALRRFRHPVPARVRVVDGKPVGVTIDRRGMNGGGVRVCAGPWRTSGDWWRDGWDRDEWDVTLSDGATYRLFRSRDTEQWFVDGVVD